MRTSLNKLQEIEHHLLGNEDTGDRLVFEANMIIDPALIGEISLQKESYEIIRQYGRRKLKAELEFVHQTLFTDNKYRAFKEKVISLFR